MKLVDNWKQAWKWFSMWAFGVIAAIPTVWLSLPEDTKKMIPDSWEKWIFVGIAAVSVIGGAGRVIDQGKPV